MKLPDNISFTPYSGWQDTFDPALRYACPEGEYNSGEYCVQLEQQIELFDEPVQRSRSIFALLTEDGVQQGSRKEIIFNPHFQTVQIHAIGIWREGTFYDRVAQSRMRVLQRESDFERSMYDESLSIISIIPDVQIGDCVELAYSIRGMNPTHQGKFSARVALNWSVPVRRTHLMVRHSIDRPVRHKFFNDDVSFVVRCSENEVRMSLARDNVPYVPYEDSVPDWCDAWAHVQLTEFDSWAAVVAQGIKLFDIAYEQKGISDVVHSLKLENLNQEEKVAKIVDYVQSRIRYQNIGYGEYQYQPHPPDVVLQQKFGDCKDKTLLLKCLLDQVGVKSAPMLVTTRESVALDQKLPANTIFDHVILKVYSPSGPLFVDATTNRQFGPLHKRFFPPYHFGLVLEPESDGLTPIVPPVHQPLVQSAYAFVVTDSDQPVFLDITNQFEGYESDRQRDHLERTPSPEIENHLLKYFSEWYQKVSIRSPFGHEIDTVANIVRSHEHYQIENSMRKEKGTPFFPIQWDLIENVLPSAVAAPRRLPIAIKHPVCVEQTITIQVPYSIQMKDRTQTVNNRYFKFEQKRHKVDGRTLTITAKYESLTDHALPQDIEALREQIQLVRNHLGLAIPIVNRPSKMWEVGEKIFIVGATLFGVVGLVLTAIRDRYGGLPQAISLLVTAALLTAMRNKRKS